MQSNQLATSMIHEEQKPSARQVMTRITQHARHTNFLKKLIEDLVHAPHI
jgi:hypothetical protein